MYKTTTLQVLLCAKKANMAPTTLNVAMLYRKESKKIHLNLTMDTYSFLFSKILVFLSFQIVHQIAAGVAFHNLIDAFPRPFMC